MSSTNIKTTTTTTTTTIHFLIVLLFFIDNGGVVEGTRNWPNSEEVKAAINEKNLASVQSQFPAGEQGVFVSVTRTVEGSYYGAGATIGVYHPKVFNGSSSSARILIKSESPGVPEHIEAGVTVNPLLNGDKKTRFYIGWTGKDSSSTCYNLECPGFVRTENDSPLDIVMNNITVHGGPQFGLDVEIYMDGRTGDWWVSRGVHNRSIGYWPSSLFNRLGNSLSIIEWGGEVSYPKNSPSPPMGSGYLPSDGEEAAFFRDIYYVDEKTDRVSLENHKDIVHKYSDSDGCYEVGDDTKKYEEGYSFYYGGPGFC